MAIIKIDRNKYPDKGAWEAVLFYYLAALCRGRVLDLESGDGELVSLISGLYGLDVVGYSDDLSRTPFSDNSFDSIVIAGILESSEAPDKIIQEAQRLCRPGGRIIIAAAKEKLISGQKRVFTRRSLEELVASRSREINWRAEVKETWFILTLTPNKKGGRVREVATTGFPQKTSETQPLVSIIIPTYNREKLIGESIQSALDQTYENYELLIIDDGSTDNTKAVVDGFCSDKIKYFYKEHTGISGTRNSGIKQAKGEYISWLSSDDEFLPNLLALQLRQFELNPALGIIYVDHYFMDSKGKIDYCCYDNNGDSREELIAIAAGGNSPIRDLGSMVRKDVYDLIGNYDQNLKMAEDCNFALRALKVGVHFKHLPLPFCKRRYHDQSITYLLNKDHTDEAKTLEYLINNFQLAEIFPKFPWDEAPKERLEAKAYGELGRKFLEKNNYLKAVDYFRLSLKKNKSADGYHGLGIACFKLGDKTRAEKYLLAALQFGANENDVLEELSYINAKYVLRFILAELKKWRIPLKSSAKILKYYVGKVILSKKVEQ